VVKLSKEFIEISLNIAIIK